MAKIPTVLSIAGSDPSGGAGIQADLKVFMRHHCYGAAVPTALTVQNATRVWGVLPLKPSFVAAQIKAVLAGAKVKAAKTGMLGSAEVLKAVLKALPRHLMLVCDPVLRASSGKALASPSLLKAMQKLLIPRAGLLTPNLAEAAALSGLPLAKSVADMEAQAKALLKLGARAVLVKGGHLPGSLSVDVLAQKGSVRRFSSPRLHVKNTHGTGCLLTAAITACLAQGLPLEKAVRRSKQFLLRNLGRKGRQSAAAY